MKKFPVKAIFLMGQTLEYADSAYPQLNAIENNPLDDDDIKAFLSTFSSLEVYCETVRLPFSLMSVTATLKILRDKPESLSYKKIKDQLKVINDRIRDELGTLLFLQVSQEGTRYLDSSRKLFGDEVEKIFPNLINEIDEAGKCLALHRSTACVFHLMRIMEAGLKNLSKELGIPYAPSWESYLNQIASKLAQKHSTKSRKWKKIEPFFKESAAHLSAVKFAWRNPTMHIVRKYNFEEAESVFNSVCVFMKHLSKHLKK